MIEVKNGRAVIGYAGAEVSAEGRTWWKSWLPVDYHELGRIAIGMHQDQAQAEAFLRQLAGLSPEAQPRPARLDLDGSHGSSARRP